MIFFTASDFKVKSDETKFIRESFLLHFCTEMSQKSWNFHRQFHFLQCNSIRKMKRNFPLGPRISSYTYRFPISFVKEMLFHPSRILQRFISFSFLPISYTLWSIDTMGCLHFLNEFQFFVDRKHYPKGPYNYFVGDHHLIHFIQNWFIVFI